MRERLMIVALRGAVVACCVLGSSAGFARGGRPGAGEVGEGAVPSYHIHCCCELLL